MNELFHSGRGRKSDYSCWLLKFGFCFLLVVVFFFFFLNPKILSLGNVINLRVDLSFPCCCRPGVLVTWETEAGGLQVPGLSELQIEFSASLDDMVDPVSK